MSSIVPFTPRDEAPIVALVALAGSVVGIVPTLSTLVNKTPFLYIFTLVVFVDWVPS